MVLQRLVTSREKGVRIGEINIHFDCPGYDSKLPISRHQSIKESWVNVNQTVLKQIISQIQKIGMDHVLIFFPSKGPNGSMLNAPRTLLAINQNRISTSIPADAPPKDTAHTIPMLHRTTLLTGPARAIFPNCSLVVLPATITAPGAIRTTPIRAARITPKRRPPGEARNSAQQPYFRACIL